MDNQLLYDAGVCKEVVVEDTALPVKVNFAQGSCQV